MAKRKELCPNCGNDEFSISPTIINTTKVVDGRLRMHDLAIRFVVGCDNCSETIKVLTEDQIKVVVD